MNSQANQELLVKIKELKAEHPYWGYRRVWAYLKFNNSIHVNKKRIYRLMKQSNLLVPRNLKLRAKRTATTSKPRTYIPNEYWGIDMTKVMIPSFGWVYLHIVIDWGSKKLLSTYMSVTSKSSDWIHALNEAINMQFPNGILESSYIPSLVSDHGSQPTSNQFMKECNELGIHQIFASYGNPKGNADTERVIRTLKEDLVWSRDFATISEFSSSLEKWQKSYNEEYPHSSLHYMTPYNYERWFNGTIRI